MGEGGEGKGVLKIDLLHIAFLMSEANSVASCCLMHYSTSAVSMEM